MEMFGVQLALEELRQSKRAWVRAKREFDRNYKDMMVRLIHQAAICYMSIDQVARFSGMTRRDIRRLMRENNLDPKASKTMLSKTAAKAVQENAALLGIKPRQMDLMSPLAYLPMGSEMRERLEQERVPEHLAPSPVTYSPRSVNAMMEGDLRLFCPDGHGPLKEDDSCMVCGYRVTRITFFPDGEVEIVDLFGGSE